MCVFVCGHWSAAFVFQIRLMDLAQTESLRGVGFTLLAGWKRVCGEIGVFIQ